MNCEQFRENLVAYLRDELSPKEKAEMADHIKGAGGCIKCRRELAKTESALRIAAAAEEEAVERIVHIYISEAIKRDASDIHFEARLWGLAVRCRVDGVLVDLNEAVRGTDDIKDPADRALLDRMDWDFGHAVVNRLKIMTGVDITESDFPQMGSISIRWQNRDYSLSGSFVPAAGGMDAVFRILPRNAPIALDATGMSTEVRTGIERMLSQPMGLILIGGPAGSGKTTVVMSLAQSLASPDRKVVTIEDPLFSKMENVTQIEVADHRGLTTSALVSRVARLDPDVVAVHLIGDADVAAKCASLALDGRLVISAFHANDAAATVWNFAEMLGDRNLASSCLVGATNQRLIRRICADCREEYTPSPQALKSLFLDPSSTEFVHGKGCEKCRNTGYWGRTTIFEVLELTQDLMDLLAAGPDAALFQSRAREATSPTLVEDGRQKVLDGISTAEEVCRVIPLPR